LEYVAKDLEIENTNTSHKDFTVKERDWERGGKEKRREDKMTPACRS
jgi:hypothetical protein